MVLVSHSDFVSIERLYSKFTVSPWFCAYRTPLASVSIWSEKFPRFTVSCKWQKIHIIDIFNSYHFSTSHVIPHIRALVPCPGLTSEVCVVASTSVPLTPTEILNLYFCRHTEILIDHFYESSWTWKSLQPLVTDFRIRTCHCPLTRQPL